MPSTSWERSILIKRSAKSNIFPEDNESKSRPIYTASYEKDEDRPQMSLLMGWEYGRQWLRERNQFAQQTVSSKRAFIENDYNWWLTKRNVELNRQKKKYTRRQQQSDKKNYNLSAFAVPKLSRVARSNQGEGQSQVDNKIKCECNDCRQKKRCQPWQPL